MTIETLSTAGVLSLLLPACSSLPRRRPNEDGLPLLPIEDTQPHSDRALHPAMQRWFAGDFLGCLNELDALATHDATSEPALLLRARALLRLERAGDVVATLSPPERFHGVDERATAAMLRGVAYGRLADAAKDDTARDLFARAFAELSYAQNLRPHKTIVAETAYFKAVVLYQIRDIQGARHALQGALKPTEDIIFARALYHSGLLLDAEEKFGQAAKAFEAAHEALKRCRTTDLGLRARIIHMLAVRQAEGVVADPAQLRILVDRVPWTTAMVLEHVQALLHVGLAFQRQGDFQKAAACFDDAALVLPDSPLDAMSVTYSAWNASLAGESMSAGSLTKLALRTVAKIDWTTEHGEARFALVEVAMLVARLGDGKHAQRLMTLFEQSPGLRSILGLAHGSRASTFTRHAQALIAAASGDVEHALQELQAVERAWTSLAHPWRALEARTDAHRVRPDHILEAAIKKQRTQLLARRADVATSAPSVLTPTDAEPDVYLSPIQRRILKRFAQELSDRQIAAQLGYAEQTIRQHFRLIYPRFGLTESPSRSQLMARLLSNPALKDSLANEA